MTKNQSESRSVDIKKRENGLVWTLSFSPPEKAHLFSYIPSQGDLPSSESENWLSPEDFYEILGIFGFDSQDWPEQLKSASFEVCEKFIEDFCARARKTGGTFNWMSFF